VSAIAAESVRHLFDRLGDSLLTLDAGGERDAASGTRAT